MSSVAWRESARYIDLSQRIAVSTTVVASPTAAAETLIVQATLPGGLAFAAGAYLFGWAAFTVGTSGVSAQLRIKPTSTSQGAKVNTGAVTVTAGNLYELTAIGFDSAPADGQLYIMSLTVASAVAASTVSAVSLIVIGV